MVDGDRVSAALRVDGTPLATGKLTLWRVDTNACAAQQSASTPADRSTLPEPMVGCCRTARRPRRAAVSGLHEVGKACFQGLSPQRHPSMDPDQHPGIRMDPDQHPGIRVTQGRRDFWWLTPFKFYFLF